MNMNKNVKIHALLFIAINRLIVSDVARFRMIIYVNDKLIGTILQV